MGKLSTHVLDTAQGKPAANMQLQLWQCTPERKLLKTMSTNGDGRTNEPLLEGEELKIGVYEIVFFVGDYFNSHQLITSDPPFLNHVPVQFGIFDVQANYHVPLLTSPWSYSTYRGS